MSIGQMSIGQMSVSQTSVAHLFFDQTTRRRLNPAIWPKLPTPRSKRKIGVICSLMEKNGLVNRTRNWCVPRLAPSAEGGMGGGTVVRIWVMRWKNIFWVLTILFWFNHCLRRDRLVICNVNKKWRHSGGRPAGQKWCHPGASSQQWHATQAKK
jgi:hypothetical protein